MIDTTEQKPEQEEPEPEPRTYDVVGQMHVTAIKTIVAKCPQADLDGNECGAALATSEMQKSTRDNRIRITTDPVACEVYDKGGTVEMMCGNCGSRLRVSKSRIRLVRH